MASHRREQLVDELGAVEMIQAEDVGKGKGRLALGRLRNRRCIVPGCCRIGGDSRRGRRARAN